jgi:hypothetical protein
MCCLQYRSSASGQSTEHQTAHRRIDERLAGGAQALVVSTEPPVVTQPCECPLHHPPRGQHTAENLWRGRQALPGDHTVRQSCRSPCGTHSPRGCGGCRTTSPRHPRWSSISSCRYRCSLDRPKGVRREGTVRRLPPTAAARLHDLECRPYALWRALPGRPYRPECGACGR